jgi:excisionase family DNA binding protein
MAVQTAAPAPGKPPDPGNRFETIDASSRRTGLSRESIRRLVQLKGLSQYRPTGKRILLNVDEIDAAIIASRVPNPT